MKTFWVGKRQLILYGMVIGGAGLIPGFSSGTMAYVLSVYPLLVGTFASVVKAPSSWLSWINAIMLIISMGLGAYLTSFVIGFLLLRFEDPLMWMFIGFIIGMASALKILPLS